MQEIALHPLSELFRAIIREYDRGMAKYGPWENLSDSVQCRAVHREYDEWKVARRNKDIHGEHGEINELVHLMNVAGKRWEQLRKSAQVEDK